MPSIPDPANDGQPFPGWPWPNYTQVPDYLLDQVMADLNHAELLVLLYIIRRTIGFQQDAASISLDQIRHGNGLVYDDGSLRERGTGLSRASVQRALKSLLERGMILAQRHESKQFGSRPTTYSLPLIRGASPAMPPRLNHGQPGHHRRDTLPIEEKQSGERQEVMVNDTETDPAAIWAAALDQLRGLVGSNVIHFDNTAGARLDAGVLVVTCPDPAAMVKWTKYAEMAAGRAVRWVRG